MNLATVDVRVAGGRNATGNLQNAASYVDLFSIDTQNPSVTSVTPKIGVIADPTVGTASFTLTVTFSEAMSTATAPTILFPVENPAATLTLNTSQSAWASNTTYVAQYDVADANSTLANVDVQVAGARDPAGNLQLVTSQQDVFSIDTLDPTVTSITPNHTTLRDIHTGTATFALTVVYGEPMNTSIAPTVSFPAENPGATLTLNSAQSGWSNSTTYVAHFDVTDANLALPTSTCGPPEPPIWPETCNSQAFRPIASASTCTTPPSPALRRIPR